MKACRNTVVRGVTVTDGLKEPNRKVIWTYVDKLKPGCEVTLDVDAYLVETTKANAQYCYEGYLPFSLWR